MYCSTGGSSMPTQRVAIAKIAGAAGKAVAAMFQRWQGARTLDPDEPGCMAAEQWPAPVRREMQAFAAGLRANSSRPPVVFFEEHVDMWSIGGEFDLVFPRHRGFYNVMADNEDLLCYRMPDRGRLLGCLTSWLRRKHVRERNPQECKWYLLNLREACMAWDSVVNDAAIVVMRQVLGGLVEDSEIEASLHEQPDWCMPPRRAASKQRR
jgi:hypothetical protein